jgi:hypothetical protein
MYGNPSNKVTCERLKKFVRGLHTKTPSVVSPEHRLKDVFNLLQQPLQAWCREQAARMKYCRMHRIKAKMSALDSVQSCMRMLTIFANYQDIRHEYLATRQVASKETLDAKAIGPDSKFWIEMHTKFLDPDEVSCWPYDHIPTVWQGTNHLTFPPPARIASGLLKGMNLEHGRRPVGFLDSFFSRAKLHQLWNDSLALYRRTHASWNSSGNNLSYPLYHFVLPVTIFDINKPHLTCGISNIQKRWDSIAWYAPSHYLHRTCANTSLRFQITENQGDFDKSFNIGNVTGGFGGPSADSAFSPTPPGSGQTTATKKRSRPALDAASSSPKVVVVAAQTQILEEFLTLSGQRIKLKDLIDKETDETEIAMMNAMLAVCAKRRTEVVALANHQ